MNALSQAHAFGKEEEKDGKRRKMRRLLYFYTDTVFYQHTENLKLDP